MAQRIKLDLTCRVTADRRAITAVALYHELGSTRFSSVHGSCWSITIFLRSVLEVTSFRSQTRIGSSEHCSVHTSGRLVRHKTLHSESSILYPLLHEDYCLTFILHRVPQVHANISQRHIWRPRRPQYTVYCAVTK